MSVHKSKTPTKDGRAWFYKISRKSFDGTFKPYISKKYKTKSEAVKEQALYLATSFEVKGSNATIDELFNLYIAKKEKEIKIQSILKLKDYFKHTENTLSKIQAEKLTIIQYEQFKNTLDNKNLSTIYKNKIHRLIKALYLFGRKYYGIKNDVVEISGGFKNTEQIENKTDFYTYDEYMLFKSKIKPIVWLSFFDTLYYLGLRKGEANALNWHDIDFINKTVTINKNCVTKIAGKPYIISSPKTKSSKRILPIPTTLLNDLTQLYEYYSMFIDFNKEWFVFGGIKPLADTTITETKNKICKEANIKQIRIHDFRHSCASLLINNGANITVVAQYLGHTDIEMTLNTYSHFYESKLLEVSNLINNL